MTSPSSVSAPRRLSLQRYGAEEVATEGDLTVSLWEAIYGERMLHDPFYATDRFLVRLRGYAAAPGFSLVLATLSLMGSPGDGERQEPITAGLSCGYTLPPGARWWNGLLGEVPEGFTTETGQRTFAINEILVHPHWQGHGIATLLHDHLLGDRLEERATLLVNPINTRARDIYIAWGWRRVASLKPFSDSPTYDAMILDLKTYSPRRDHALPRVTIGLPADSA